MQFREVGPEFDSSTVDRCLPFTQSTPYFVWNTNCEREGYRFVGTRDGKDIFFAQFFVYPTQKIRVLYAPLGPIMTSPLSEEDIEDFVTFLLDVTRGGNYSFIRMHLATGTANMRKASEHLAFSSFTQPQYDRVIPLDTEYVLPNKANRTVKKAKKELSLEVAEIKKEAIDDFLTLLRDTGQRKSLRLHSEEYYRALLNLSSVCGTCVELLFAVYNEKRVATMILVRDGKNATYLFGGTSEEGKKKGAQYFLQWSAIQLARESGMKCYSFGGTLKNLDNKRNSFYSVSFFKKKFGGSIKDYGDSYDIVINGIHYGLYTVYKFLRRIL